MATSKKKTKSLSLNRLWKWYFIGLGLFLVFMFTISLGWWGKMPNIRTLEDPRTALATEIYSEDGAMLGKLYRREDRSNINYTDIPQHMVDALVATEDARFYRHSGIDIRAVIRAVTKLGRDGGGSTISQQLAKNLFHDPPKSKVGRIIQKFKEWIIAVKLEKRYAKHEIITMYFNTVPWGNSYGIKSAAKTYFNKDVIDLKPEESAVLVGMLRAPTTYDPKRNPDNAKRVRNTVLNQKEKYKYITEKQCDSLKALNIVLDYNYTSHNYGSATYFREQVHQYMKAWCKKNGYDVYEDGLKVYTTIDSKMQKYAEDAVANHMKSLQASLYKEVKDSKVNPWRDEEVLWKEDVNYIPKNIKKTDQYKQAKAAGKSDVEIDRIMKTPVKMTIFTWNGTRDTMLSPIDSLKHYKMLLHTGFMAMNPKTGFVKAWVGGIDFRHFKYDHVNKYATRQVGSTFKPIVYARAIEDQVIQPCELVSTGPVTFETENGQIWSPQNSSRPPGDPLRIYDGLKHSVNTTTARVMKRMEPNSPSKVKDFSDRLGIDTKNFMPYVSICLGTMDISVYEMVGAYAAFANNGVWTEPIYITRIEDKNGNVLEEFIPKTVEAMNKQTAYVMCKMLQKVPEGGTATRLRSKYGVPFPVGGKTGTTQNNSDGWFMGISPDLVAGCWVGAEDRQVHFRSTALGQGANMALPIYGLFMKKVWDDKDIHISHSDFERPDIEFTIETDCNLYKAPTSGTVRPDAGVPGIGPR
ncbi:MAG: transglycosylase domain-containing protein [Flavobacteriales bacterium]|nr:transglycosylase domain-containing protein [Flavobacteriales bacterium]